MISSKIENLKCELFESIQKKEIYELMPKKNKIIEINHLDSKIFRLKVMFIKNKRNELM